MTFTLGQTTGNIFLRISEDDVPELDKSFKIRLLNVSHGRLGNQTVSTLTVLASDDPYGLFVFSETSRPIRVAEANTLVVLTIQRRKGLMGRVRVTYRTLSNTDPMPYSIPGVGRASAGSDFVPILESVTFSANQSEANVTIRILDDGEPERAESVFVELSSVILVEGAQMRPGEKELSFNGHKILIKKINCNLIIFGFCSCFVTSAWPEKCLSGSGHY